MPFLVFCRCAYLAGDYAGVPQHVWEAHKYVHALKGDNIKGYASIPVRNAKQLLNQLTRGQAPQWFGVHAADMLAGVAAPYYLVPIPSSSAAVGSTVVSRTLVLANEVQKALASAGVAVLDAIRWDKALVPAHQGGPRFADEVYPHVRIIAQIPKGARVVLVDDVKTSGGHLQAVAAALREHHAEVIHAVCGGCTVKEAVGDSWTVTTEVLEDYEPPEF